MTRPLWSLIFQKLERSDHKSHHLVRNPEWEVRRSPRRRINWHDGPQTGRNTGPGSVDYFASPPAHIDIILTDGDVQNRVGWARFVVQITQNIAGCGKVYYKESDLHSTLSSIMPSQPRSLSVTHATESYRAPCPAAYRTATAPPEHCDREDVNRPRGGFAGKP